MEKLNSISAAYLLLKGRIEFRKKWALQDRRLSTLNAKDIAWETKYDEDHNFARMGREVVDDDFGRAPVQKVKKRTKRSSIGLHTAERREFEVAVVKSVLSVSATL